MTNAPIHTLKAQVQVIAFNQLSSAMFVSNNIELKTMNNKEKAKIKTIHTKYHYVNNGFIHSYSVSVYHFDSLDLV